MLGCSELLSHSEHCEEAYGALLALRRQTQELEKEPSWMTWRQLRKEAQRLLVQEKAAMDE